MRSSRLRSRNLTAEPSRPPPAPFSAGEPSPVSYIQPPAAPPADPAEVGPSEFSKRARATAPKPAPKKPIAPPPEPPHVESPIAEIPEELIAKRAYEIWERRGRRHGENDSNWFAAKSELEQERLRWAAPREDDRKLNP